MTQSIYTTAIWLFACPWIRSPDAAAPGIRWWCASSTSGPWNAIKNRAFGILNFSGANGTSIRGNRAFGNPTGISVQGSTGVTVARNHAFGNTLDLQWDGTGTNTFKNNHCNTSAPPGLCH